LAKEKDGHANAIDIAANRTAIIRIIHGSYFFVEHFSIAYLTSKLRGAARLYRAASLGAQC
jgi:hypothetical protein